MQTPFELFNEIENNLPVEQIKCKGLSIWQFLRFQYQLQYMKLYTVNGLISQKTSITKKLKRILIIFKNSFWGFFNYYKKSHYILFSNQYNNKLIDEKISDKFSHHIIKHLGPQLLIFQDPANMEHISIKNYYHKRYTSSWSLYIRCLPKIFMSLINCLKYKIEGEEILKQVEKSIGIHINYRFKTSLFFIFSNFLNKNFKKRNTKLIFVECYHGIIHQAAIYAAKKNNIPSIEIQHGLISKTYEGYILPKKIGQECFPDYLFAFGNYVKETLGDSFINNKNIYPVGYFYIEYIKKQAKYNEYFKEYFNKLRLSYKTIVTISGQDTIDKELFIFIEKAALLDNQILYLFIPRTFNNNYYKISLPSNIKIKPDIDFYYSLYYSDFHATVYSTCALEAPFYGIPNLFINIKGLSQHYYGEIMNDSSIVSYCNNPEELIDSIKNKLWPPKNEIEYKGQRYYTINCEENSIKIINDLLKNKNRIN